jgi:hypothetical protein
MQCERTTIILEIKYKMEKMEYKIIIHRGWNIGRLKHEIAFVLNISAGRIICKSRMKEAFREWDDIDEYWMFNKGKIDIEENGKEAQPYTPNRIEVENRDVCMMWFSDGVRTSNFKSQPNWTQKEIYEFSF